jgi:hypothetical protein
VSGEQKLSWKIFQISSGAAAIYWCTINQFLYLKIQRKCTNRHISEVICPLCKCTCALYCKRETWTEMEIGTHNNTRNSFHRFLLSISTVMQLVFSWKICNIRTIFKCELAHLEQFFLLSRIQIMRLSGCGSENHKFMWIRTLNIVTKHFFYYQILKSLFIKLFFLLFECMHAYF